jgi:hypothetical protein
MAVKLPYMTAPGAIPKILAKIDEAKRPERSIAIWSISVSGLSRSACGLDSLDIDQSSIAG